MGLVVSDVGTVALGAWGCFKLEVAGVPPTAVAKLRLAAGPVGGALETAGPRGGDLAEGVLGSFGLGRSASFVNVGPGPEPGRGECSRDGRGERALARFSCGEDLLEAACEVIAEDMPDSLGGVARLYWCLSSLRLGERDLGRNGIPRDGPGDRGGGLLPRRP